MNMIKLETIILLPLFAFNVSISLKCCTVDAFSMSNEAVSITIPVEQKIRIAMNLSTDAQSNITAAYSAIEVWEDIFQYPEKQSDNKNNNIYNMQSTIQIFCKALYAASLVRIGKDDDALIVYDETLDLLEIDMNLGMWIDVKIGKGESLQRLMKYEEAQKEFLQVCSMGHDQKIVPIGKKQSQCACKAALCSLRLGNLQTAETILNEFQRERVDQDKDSTVAGMLGAVQLEMKYRFGNYSGSFNESMKLLEFASLSDEASPVYKWFYALMSKNESHVHGDVKVPPLFENQIKGNREQYLQIAAINQSPYDDVLMQVLDDKVLLHDLLSNHSKNDFWPIGFVLPREKNAFKQHYSKCNNINDRINPEKKWIIKRPCGYGSHGNKIVSFSQAIKEADLQSDQGNILCQKLIQSPLCYEDKRFSIRVYVICFSREKEISVYLCSSGLMKLALSRDDDIKNQNDAYMTNSGRVEGDGATQYDFIFMKKFIDEKYVDGSYDTMWDLVRESVSHLMTDLCGLQSLFPEDLTSRSKLFGSVPKILGFDYIIDQSLKPWLMEVNRFPGLESRGGNDARVKAEVVNLAWNIASKREFIDNSGSELDDNNFETLSIRLKHP
mmetsp:Transcript_1167/g.1419  ORF Transcript_1167/g.1419 Transcript_1167/m.1419 type:complete len:612 (+) Transcript_1167:290-2125(+)